MMTTRRKRVLKAVAKFGVTFGLVALVTMLPLFVFLFQGEHVTTGKGDERVLEKERPYILGNEYNVPHLCDVLRVVPQTSYLEEASQFVIEVSTPVERPRYEQHYSTYSFIEEVVLENDAASYLSYYLPNSSHVAIKSCGKTTDGNGIAFSIPIFNEYSALRHWLDELSDGIREPDSSEIVDVAHFPACASTSIFRFDTSGYPDKRWYFLLSANYKNDLGSLNVSLDLTFTKFLLQNNSKIIGNCTASAGNICTLPAPSSGDDVYLILRHLTTSTYPYPVKTMVFCEKYKKQSYLLYFLVIPFCSSLGIFFLYSLCEYGYDYFRQKVELRDSEVTSDPVTLVSQRFLEESPDHHGDVPDFDSFQDLSTRAPSSDSPPDYELSHFFPPRENDEGNGLAITIEDSVSTNSGRWPNNLSLTQVGGEHVVAVGNAGASVSSIGRSAANGSVENPPDYETVVLPLDRGSDHQQRPGETSSTTHEAGYGNSLVIILTMNSSNDSPLPPPPPYNDALSMD